MKTREPEDRFKEKVEVMQTGCHEWQSTIKKDGYGSFYLDGRQVQAHRAAYKLFVGEIPAGVRVLHHCDNRKCVNTDHLFLGTDADNIADMDAKQRRGTKSPLTYADVAEIMKMIENRYTQEEIGKKFGVRQTTISKIKLGIVTHFKT